MVSRTIFSDSTLISTASSTKASVVLCLSDSQERARRAHCSFQTPVSSIADTHTLERL